MKLGNNKTRNFSTASCLAITGILHLEKNHGMHLNIESAKAAHACWSLQDLRCLPCPVKMPLGSVVCR